jgi:moderate conductance mechanosensitive channel
MLSNLLIALGRALGTLALQIVIIAVLAWAVIRIISAIERRTVARLERTEPEPGRRARLLTLISTAARSLQVIIVILAVLMVLYALGINITPVLAGVGVAGLAVSLGAQALIRDFISGCLILIENQFRVGDVIKAGEAIGTVEQFSLRATYVRDDQGRLWIVPNGDIRTVSNYTRDWARAVVELNVPSDTDMTTALAALETAMQTVAADPSLRPALLETPHVEGWYSQSDTAVQVRLAARTQPGQQWDVARALRHAALDALRNATVNGSAHDDD